MAKQATTTAQKAPNWRKRMDAARAANVCYSCGRHKETGEKVSLRQIDPPTGAPATTATKPKPRTRKPAKK